MKWNFFGTSKQVITSQYLGECLGDDILKETFHPRTRLPASYDVVEWLFVRAFIVGVVLRDVFNDAVADHAYGVLLSRIMTSEDVTEGLTRRFAGLLFDRYNEYSNVLNVWLTQKDEKPLIVALQTYVSPGSDFDTMVEIFARFEGSVKATQYILGEIESKYEVKTE
jgi:hypothetical protein